MGLASFFIFDHISARAFWSDEADVANIIDKPFSKLASEAVVDGHPLFYPYLLKIWSLIFGDSEFSLRGFSAFWGLWLIVLFYQAGKDFFRNNRIGLLAAFLASSSYFLIWFATQNKVYTLAALMGLMSYYFFIKLLDGSRKQDYFFYLFLTAVSVYIHPWLFLVFLSQVFNALLTKNFRILFIQGIIFVLAIPALAITFYQGSLGTSVWINQVSFWTIFESFKYLTFGSTWIYFISFLIACFYIFIGKDGFKDAFSSREITINTALVSYLFLPLVLSVLISQFKGAYVIGRYEMIVLPAFILLAANLFHKIENKYVLFLIMFLIAGSAAGEVIKDRNLVFSYQSTDKTIALDIFQQLNDGDTIIATDLSFSTFYYYLSKFNKGADSKDFDLISFPKEISLHPGWKDLSKMIRGKQKYEVEAEELVTLLKEKDAAVWVLYNDENEINQILKESLKERFELKEIIQPLVPREPAWFDLILKFH